MEKVDPHSQTLVGLEPLNPVGTVPEVEDEARLVNGELLREVFRIERFIASGGMGQVFRARDLRLERPVAVKVLHGRLLQSKSGLERFQREARSMSKVVHPNVVATFEVGTHKESPFLVMEYVDGPTLGTYIRRKGRLKIDETLKLIGQIASGLEEAHAIGIIHRDVKPGNILLHRLRSGGMLAKVVDFGLASVAEDSEGGVGEVRLTGRQEIMGSPLYMSPEQIEGRVLSGASDQYSLAIVAFEMLCGAPPFLGDSLNAIFQGHLMGEVPRLEERCEWENVGAVGLVLKRALHKIASERFATLSEFMSELREASGVVTELTEDLGNCDVCHKGVASLDGYCRACGSPVPLAQCAACGTPRRGKRYHCISCSASLLPGRKHGSREVGTDSLNSDVSFDRLSTLGVVIVLEASGGKLTPSLWKRISELFDICVERENGRSLAVLGYEAYAAFGLGGFREREVERAIDSALSIFGQASRELEAVGLHSEVELQLGVELGTLETEGVGLSWGTARVLGEGVSDARNLVRGEKTSGVYVGKNAWREIRALYESQIEGSSRRLLSRRRVAIMRDPSTVGGIEVPFVGRDYELAHLQRAFERVVNRGKLVVVPVIGPPGVGKSRVVSEFLGTLNQKSSLCNVDLSQCIPSSEGVPFAPFRTSFRNRYSVYDEDDYDSVVGLMRLLPGVRDLEDDVALQRIEHLSTLLGLNSGSRGELGFDSAAMPWHSPNDPIQELAFEAYTHYIRAFAQEAPYVLVVDDLQWVRPSTLKLLSYLAQGCSDSPVLLVLTVRDRDADKTVASVEIPAIALSSMELAPLSLRDVKRLIETLFGENVVEDSLLQTLHELTNGLPQEVEGHLEALVEEGVLRNVEGQWKHFPSQDSAHAQLPGSLRELVQQRIARLGQEEQRLLRAAALAGQTFSIELLSAMVDRVVDDVELDELVQEGWLMESETGDFLRTRELSFRQDRIRDIVMDLSNQDASRTLHLKATNWLDSLIADVAPQARTARLARHYREAGEIREGAKHTLDKAREFLTAFASTEAFEAFGEALEMAREMNQLTLNDPELKPIYLESALGRAQVGWILGEHEEALRVLDEITPKIHPEEDQSLWSRLQVLRGEMLIVQGNYEAAIQLHELLLKRLNHKSYLDMGPLVLGRVAFSKLELNQFKEAEATARQILDGETEELRESVSWCRGAGSATGVLARIALQKKEYGAARTLYAQSRSYREEAGDPVGASMARVGEGNVSFLEGNLEQAGQIYQDAAGKLTDLGFRFGAGQAYINLSETLLLRGQAEKALASLQSAEETMRMVRSHTNLAEVLRLKSEALLDLGQKPGALSVAHEGMALAENNGLDDFVAVFREKLTLLSSP